MKLNKRYTMLDYLLYETDAGMMTCPHGPAVRFDDGSFQYRLNNYLQNIVGPAIINKGNYETYYINDKKIRSYRLYEGNNGTN